MTLPINNESYDYKFQKTLNQDVELKSNEYGRWDLNMENGDYVNTTGLPTLKNACIIAILTRYGELMENPTYHEFGCHVHRIIKDNKTKMNLFKIENYITQTLNNIRRVKTVNELKIIENEHDTYNVYFTITSHNDETIKGNVNI